MQGCTTLPASTIHHSQKDVDLFAPGLARAHLVGIAGSGMRPLADVLSQAGWTITGSDIRAEALAGLPYKVGSGHRTELIDPHLDLLVHSDAVASDDPEVARARALVVPVLSYPQVLGQLMNARRGVAIAGTHGKSTTTAMAGDILSASGLDPTVLYGAAPIQPTSASRLGHSRWLVAEACEYRENFRHLKPQMAVVLGMELDHVDCYAQLADVEAAFARFVSRVPAEGVTIIPEECAASRRATANVACSVETFGLSPAATWQAASLRERRGYYSFEIRQRRRFVCEVKLAVPGKHNVANALAAAAIANHCGASAAATRTALEHFQGLSRRLEVVADDGSIAVLNDYAHHPTEIAAALSTVRQMYPGQRLWCIFEPHQASRIGRLLDEFARALHNADKILVTDIYRVREKPTMHGVTAADLCRRAQELGADATHVAGAAEIKQHLQPSVRGGDVIVTLSAGLFGALAHELGQRFCAVRKAG
ncbi:MAG: UDP-N-acetylmuramate--L-alanine ligase [Pirellulales bacterium]